jgi:REP element-mobilizing transposase RayT
LCLYCYNASAMRQPRIDFPGALHHVYSRGNGKQSIFLSNTDRDDFLALFSKACAEFSWRCHSYCLLCTHYHFLLETPEGLLADGMQFLNGAYGSKFNQRYKKSGHVMQGRYHSPLVERDSYYLELLRYIALNPVKSNLVTHPRDWRWSSFRALAGFSPTPAFLDTSLTLDQFSSDRLDARSNYASFVLERLQEALEAAKGTPSLEDLFRSVTGKQERNSVISVAYFKYGYSMSEIARYLSIAQPTVSRVLAGQRNRETIPGLDLYRK